MLHVTNGDSAATSLRQAHLGGEVLAWRDVLEEGPVPLTAVNRELNAARAEFFAGCGWPNAMDAEVDFGDRDARLLGAGALTLWFEHDLSDQLQLLQVLNLLRVTRPPRLDMICIDAFAGHPEFRGLGELTAEELTMLWPVRTPITADQLDCAALGWAAVRSKRPDDVARLASTPGQALPFLAETFSRLLEEYPATRDGLARSEREILTAVTEGATTPGDVYRSYARSEPRHASGDWVLFRRLLDLAALAGDRDDPQPPGRPLLTVRLPDGSLPDGEATTTADFLHAEVRITEDGARVMAGDLDRPAVLPLDRWIGGVHLIGSAPQWRWNPATQQLEAAASA